MVMYEIHSHPVLQKYKTHICSRASVFQLFIAIFTVLFPLLVAYASQGIIFHSIFTLLACLRFPGRQATFVIVISIVNYGLQ
jgi:hypothetical protein